MIQENSGNNKNNEATNNQSDLDNTSKKKSNALKNYKIIYSIFFKYGTFIIIIILATAIFSLSVKKEKILVVENKNEAKETLLIKNLNDKIDETEKIEKDNKDIDIQINHGLLNTYNMIESYNNLISYKGFTLPRWVFFSELETVQNKEYFNNNNYDIEQLNNFIKNIILINEDENVEKGTNQPTYIELDDNNVEKTFYLSCVNRPRIFNGICNKYIDNFLNGFFVYNISNDLQGFTTIAKNLVTKHKYEKKLCEGISKYIKYSSSAPNEFEDILTICGGTYLEEFYKTQNFLKVTNELEKKLLTQNISKYREINEYKLISFQQIIYNNLEKGIPPYEGMYKSYINYISNLLKKHTDNPIDPIYFDITYLFNNLYITQNLNKIKYQLTSTKKEEIDSILTDLEKINNGDKIDGYVGLKSVLINNSMVENIKNYKTNFNTERDDIMELLLKNLKKLNYLKIINDEIEGNIIKINGYISLDLNSGGNLPVPFKSTLENNNGKLIVKEFSLNIITMGFGINDILEIILAQKSHSIGEVYEYIQKNIALYDSSDYNDTPCSSIENKLNESNIEGLELKTCNENKITIMKGGIGKKILYQFNMNNYSILSIKTTDNEIQKFIDEDFVGINTNSNSISNAVRSIISYTPTEETGTNYIEGSNNAINAIEDLKSYLGVEITDIVESGGKFNTEFALGDINLIGTYDTKTKKLGPIFIKLDGEENVIISNFSIYLTQENTNEINKFLIEPLGYLYELNKNVITKYFPEQVEELLNSK